MLRLCTAEALGVQKRLYTNVPGRRLRPGEDWRSARRGSIREAREERKREREDQRSDGNRQSLETEPPAANWRERRRTTPPSEQSDA